MSSQPDFHSSASFASLALLASAAFFSYSSVICISLGDHFTEGHLEDVGTLRWWKRQTSFSAFLALPPSFFAFPPFGAISISLYWCSVNEYRGLEDSGKLISRYHFILGVEVIGRSRFTSIASICLVMSKRMV